MSEQIPEHIRHNFIEQVHKLKQAGPLTKKDQALKLASAVDVLVAQKNGLSLLYDHIGDIVDAGFFAGTSWEDTAALNASLVGGTLKSGGMNTVYEIVSELRLLAIANERLHSQSMPREEAFAFLEELTVTNLDLLFPDATDVPQIADEETRKRIRMLFGFLEDEFIRWESLAHRLVEELEMLCCQRPVITDRAKSIIRTMREQRDQDEGHKPDSRLQFYIDAIYAPSPKASDLTPGGYESWLQSRADGGEKLDAECEAMAVPLRKTGLTSPYHALLLHRVKDQSKLVGKLLGLNAYGMAELEAHHSRVSRFIEFACHPDTCRMVYGLAGLLERNLLSRQPVATGLQRVLELELHSGVAQTLRQSRPESRCSPEQHVFADTICVLGQPLGIGQGWNPTCQSARGISLWSRHSPGKLLGMIHTAATNNDLEMRFESQLLKSSQLGQGLAKELDYKLDAVSIVLVPHLDRIYSEMTRRASGRGEDPHKWVNPAMYGHWIPTGFISPYNYLMNTISGYEHFLRLFYATHHPTYNDGHDLAHPNPVGIFLTAANGKLQGFHAVSIHRVAEHEGETRLYFLNPNNEGRQKWRSDIQPTVAGNGEEAGESSLPFYQFASCLYAFHYKPSEAGGVEKIPADEIEKIIGIAKNSWGASYTWQDAPQPAKYPSLL